MPPGVLLGNIIPGGPERLAEIAETAGNRAPGAVLSRVLAAELRGVVEQLIPAGLSREASQAWVGHWLDEKIPALKGRTPRQAALSDRHWPLLEALLRQFEWQEDMRRHTDPAASGGGELAWLREQLEMPVQP